MRITWIALAVLCAAITSARAQIQVDLKFARLQYIAYEPVIATIGITNLAGRDIELRDADGETWFGFEVTGSETQQIAPVRSMGQPPLRIEAGKRVTQKINLTPLFPVHDYGAYHVRAHVYFPDLQKYFYSQAKVFEVTDARPIWQQTVGVPDGTGPGGVRTYSLLSNRFPDHTSLYVRVQDKDNGIVFATYSLGRMIIFDDPKVEIDATNQLHVLHTSAPRTWSYSVIGLNGELVSHTNYMETKSRPHLVHAANGEVAVRGGMPEMPAAAQGPAGTNSQLPKLSERPESD